MLTRHLVAWIKTQSVLVQYVNVVETFQILVEYAWQVSVSELCHTYIYKMKKQFYSKVISNTIM